jgi:hypothetical protein
MKRLPVLLLACCAAPRTRAEDAVKLSDLDWSGLAAAIAEGWAISGVRALKLSLRAPPHMRMPDAGRLNPRLPESYYSGLGRAETPMMRRRVREVCW